MEISREDILGSQKLIVDLFRSFRDELMASYGNAQHNLKVDRSLVTEFDLKVENTLKIRLGEAYPKIGFAGEETGKSDDNQTYWLIDPIDSTDSFIRGLPFCTNMAALISNGQVLASVIYNFVSDNTYTATLGGGAYKNGNKLNVSNSRQSGNLVVYTMGGYRFSELHSAMSDYGIKYRYPIGAAGYDYVLLSEGVIDGVLVVYTKNKIHDNAPGILLAMEAGCKILSFDSEKYDITNRNFLVGCDKVIDLLESDEKVRAIVTNNS